MAKYTTIKTPQYTKDEKGNKVFTGYKEKQYRIDADFVPTKVDEICEDFIDNYCEKNNQDDWMIAEMESTIISKSGKEIPKPFTLIRKEFAEKFFNLSADTNHVESWRKRMIQKYKK